MPPTAWIPQQEILAWRRLTCFDVFVVTAKSLWDKADRCKSVGSHYVSTVPNQIFLEDAAALTTEYWKVVPNSVARACAEVSLKPIVIGKMH